MINFLFDTFAKIRFPEGYWHTVFIVWVSYIAGNGCYVYNVFIYEKPVIFSRKFQGYSPRELADKAGGMMLAADLFHVHVNLGLSKKKKMFCPAI